MYKAVVVFLFAGLIMAQTPAEAGQRLKTPEINMHEGPKGPQGGKDREGASVSVSIHNPDGTKVTKSLRKRRI